jgi:ADP-ribosylglycohydrolase
MTDTTAPATTVPPAGADATAPRLDRARGLLLGLLLGDARAYRDPEPTYWLTGSAAGQLACFTVEGLIRRQVAQREGGLDGSPAFWVWFAYRRWARGQGAQVSPPVMHNAPWPDGWLSQEAPLRNKRGRAPATWKSIQTPSYGSAEHPLTRSAGHHALSNAAPSALFFDAQDVSEVAADIAALTHGSPSAHSAAAEGARLLARALTASTVEEALELAVPSDAPLGTAQHALNHAVATVRFYPSADTLLQALSTADRAGGRGACIFTGALLGAVHGSAALPEDRLAALELGRVGYRLAADAIACCAAGREPATRPLWPDYPRTH